MIFFLKSQNNLYKYLNAYLSQDLDCTIIEDLEVFEKIKELKIKSLEDNTIHQLIFFKDKYLDYQINYENFLSKAINTCKEYNIKFIYIDSVDLYGLTEKTSVSEANEVHEAFKLVSKVRERSYKLLLESNINYCIIRIPDILGKGCNYFFNDFFNNQSNFLKWSGLTYINHEFICIEDLIKIIKFFIINNIKGEYNISGSKYTLEQIAASINELTSIPVKIRNLSSILLFIKSFYNPLAKRIFETSYLYAKPVFLNGSKFESEFGKIQKTDLNQTIANIINSKT